VFIVELIGSKKSSTRNVNIINYKDECNLAYFDA